MVLSSYESKGSNFLLCLVTPLQTERQLQVNWVLGGVEEGEEAQPQA